MIRMEGVLRDENARTLEHDLFSLSHCACLKIPKCNKERSPDSDFTE